MAKKIVLQVDGGGILGITPAFVLMKLEECIKNSRNNDENFRIRDILALCCGTSTGAIIAGFVAAGISTEKIYDFYCNDGVTLFKSSKNPIFTRFIQPKFKRQPFLDKLDEILTGNSADHGSKVELGELSLNLMTTAYNLSSHRTHFIKSYDDHDKHIHLRDCIAWSALSAAYYFGKINVPNYTWVNKNNDTPPLMIPETGAVFQDGGQGTQNCTLDFVLTEIFAQQWDNNDEVIIISLGTGGKTKFDRYDIAKEISDIGQTVKYIFNQARDESTTVQKLAADYIQSKRRNIKLFRLDYEAKEDYKLDDVDHVDVYKAGASKIVASTEFQELCNQIVS